MTVSQESQLVAFDADEAVAAAQTAADGGLRLAVEYTDESFRTLYAGEAMAALYDDREAMRAHFESVHDYVGIDFTERDLFTDTLRAAGGVRAMTTYMDNATVLRVFGGETEGVLFSLDPGTDVTAVVQAVEGVIHGGGS